MNSDAAENTAIVKTVQEAKVEYVKRYQKAWDKFEKVVRAAKIKRKQSILAAAVEYSKAIQADRANISPNNTVVPENRLCDVCGADKAAYREMMHEDCSHGHGDKNKSGFVWR